MSIRRMGKGQQFEIKWRGEAETTWEAGARIRRQVPEMVKEFFDQLEEQQQQQM